MMAIALPTDRVLVYDGDCAFCRYCVGYAAAVAGERVSFRPFQEAAVDYPEVPIEDFRASIQLFTPHGRSSGADAAFRVLALQARLAGWHWCYRHLPLFATLAEFVYRWTARHRSWALRAATFAFGGKLRPLDYGVTASIMTRAIGAIFLIAFISWSVQANGLIGADGILPLQDFFAAVARQLGKAGYYLVPSAYWIAPSDTTTLILIGIGVVASLTLMANRFAVIGALAAYLAYLSLYYGSQIFMSYQWDRLLLECGVLLILLNLNTRISIGLFRLLVFRFMFLSGAVKLLSGDPAWANLSALDYHFETQPLPTPLAWYASHLPDAMLHFGVAATLVIELILPFFIFMPRNLRLLAAAGFIFLELLIFATGNYNFFNLLTIVMCLSLLDDRIFCRSRRAAEKRHGRPSVWRAIFCTFLLLGTIQIHATFAGRDLPGWERALVSWVNPWALVNGYGVFAVMTTERDELIVQGSDDGEHWWDYVFRYKPQALDTAPRWVAPHQPRLDWQMWFAALQPAERVYWIDNFVAKLLLGSDDVANLMRPTGHTPHHIRILRYRYRFGSPAERAVGHWWHREYLGIWYPATSLREPEISATPMEIPQ